MIFLQLEIHYGTNTAQSSIKDFLPLITVVVTLLLFIIDRLLASRIRRKEVERSWYLKVLIEPNLEKINNFFDSVGKTYEEAANFLIQNGGIPHADYVILCAQENEKFIDLKRVIIAYLIYPLSNRYQEISQKVDECLQKLEDDFTVSIDKGHFSTEEINLFKLRSYELKTKLLSILYVPLNTKK